MSITEFLFGPENTNMVYSVLPVLAIAAIAQGVTSIFKGIAAGKRRKEAQKERERINKQIARAEANRQKIINPASKYTFDLSSNLSNPFSSLQVATGAAEFQAAETDISLASTLDTLRDTGAGAGGATSLAQAAARSKTGIAASIQQQEMQNEKLRAQGESQLQGMIVSEQQRVQNALTSGAQFAFAARERRENQQLNRLAGGQEQTYATEANAISQGDSAIGGLMGTASAAAGSWANGDFKTQG